MGGDHGDMEILTNAEWNTQLVRKQSQGIIYTYSDFHINAMRIVGCSKQVARLGQHNSEESVPIGDVYMV